MDELYARLGRMVERAERAEAGFNSLLDTFAKVVSGEIGLDRVMVNLTDRNIIWAPEGFRPDMPATINGLPKCVVMDPAKVATIDAQRQVIEKLDAELKALKDGNAS